jgi:hypothetical protein
MNLGYLKADGQTCSIDSDGVLHIPGNPGATLKIGQLQGSSAVPTLVAGPGAGTGPTPSIIGNNVSGIIGLVAGTSPTASSVVLTLNLSGGANFPNTFGIISPTLAASALLTGASAVYCKPGPNCITLNVGSTPLVGGTTYQWAYHIIGA